MAVAAVVLLQGLFTYAPFMQALFASADLPLAVVPGILGAGVAVLLVLELEKLLLRRFHVSLD
jgi:hypothetical protein